MGLRELKAERTRTAIASAALDLFERQGYEATTMEQIAEVAEVGATTLYRYFPTKDSTLLFEFVGGATRGLLAAALSARPEDEPLDIALGHALHEQLQAIDEDAERFLRLRRQLDIVPTARARVWDSWYQEQTLLEQAIAERSGADPTELWVQLAAHSCMMVMQMALDMMRSATEPRSAADSADQIIGALSSTTVVLPKLPSV